MSAPQPHPALSATGLTKLFQVDDQTIVANDEIDLILDDGALHAIVGENGAGKSTLAHILSGQISQDTGSVNVFGSSLPSGNASASRDLGIGLVAQHFTLVDTLSVWENVVLGDEPQSFGVIDRNRAREIVVDLAASLRLDISPNAQVGDLPFPTRQGVEIIKALARNARILILDEPTSVLGPQESVRLFERIENLRASGTTILLVTHRIQEVLDHATHVTVLRRGRSVASFNRDQFDSDQIVKAIIGPSTSLPETVGRTSPADNPAAPRQALKLTNISTSGSGTRPRLNGLSLSVEAGTIVGLAGVAGNGQSELAETVAGIEPFLSGEIQLEGTTITNASTRERRGLGLGYIPEDRRRSGLVGSFSIQDNLFLGDRTRIGNRWRYDVDAASEAADQLIREYDIRTPTALAKAASLSGGNQQKVILARELSRDPSCLLAVHPTHGLDLGASAFVHSRLQAARENGCGILLISSDLEELRALSDRIAVIFAGQIAGTLDAADFDEQQIGNWMTSGLSE